MKCEWCYERLASVSLTISASPLAGGSTVHVEHSVCEPCLKDAEVGMGAGGIVDDLRKAVA